MSGAPRDRVPLTKIGARAFRVPTDAPESDGTLTWRATTLVVVTAEAGGLAGLGYTYAHQAAAVVVNDTLAGLVKGRDAMDLPALWTAVTAQLRNLGDSGLTRMAAAGLDNALWDLKARLLDLPLFRLLGASRPAIPAYGSGGFTSYDDNRLRTQLGGWAKDGLSAVKMKIGRDPDRDPQRVRLVREALPEGTALYVDANGGYAPKQATAMAERLAGFGVTWLEEPVPYRDLAGLRLVRERAPAGMEVVSGEYAFNLADFLAMLQAGACDVVQADATRCGTTGFLQASVLCQAWRLPLSSHCAPALHAHLCCACPPARNLEYFYDHVRIEDMLFEGAPHPVEGELAPAMDRPGLGLTLKEADARPFAI